MTNGQKIMSDLEGLTFDDWHMFHCDSDVQGIAIDALNLLKEQQEIINELNTAIKEWRNLKWFTPYEVGIAMVTHGQKDPQFKWGETIKYSPAEVEKILNEVNRDE